MAFHKIYLWMTCSCNHYRKHRWNKKNICLNKKSPLSTLFGSTSPRMQFAGLLLDELSLSNEYKYMIYRLHIYDIDDIQNITTSYLNNNFIIIKFKDIITSFPSMSILNSQKRLRLESFRRPYQKFRTPHHVAAREILVRLLLSNSVGRRNLYVWEPGFRSICSSTKNAGICPPLVLFGSEVF